MKRKVDEPHKYCAPKDGSFVAGRRCLECDKKTEPRGAGTMRYVLEFECMTDKGACIAAEATKHQRGGRDNIQILRLTNVSYPDSAGHVLIPYEASK